MEVTHLTYKATSSHEPKPNAAIRDRLLRVYFVEKLSANPAHLWPY
jgi:hypothetical protein